MKINGVSNAKLIDEVMILSFVIKNGKKNEQLAFLRNYSMDAVIDEVKFDDKNVRTTLHFKRCDKRNT